MDNENENEHKNAISITSPRPPINKEEPKINEQSAEKYRWGPDGSFCKNQGREEEENKVLQQETTPAISAKAPSKKTKNSELD